MNFYNEAVWVCVVVFFFIWVSFVVRYQVFYCFLQFCFLFVACSSLSIVPMLQAGVLLWVVASGVCIVCCSKCCSNIAV